VHINAFQKVELEDNFYDVAISNVPFGNHPVFDKRYNKENFKIHDYFFAKALDKVRTNGIVAFITTKGTMDKMSSNVREYIAKRKIDWTKHCLNRLNQRNILISDVKTAINNGKIIEYYYDDYPYPSCLILGYNTNNKTIHIVCGVSEDTVHMITAYYPNTDKWEEDMKTRREK